MLCTITEKEGETEFVLARRVLPSVRGDAKRTLKPLRGLRFERHTSITTRYSTSASSTDVNHTIDSYPRRATNTHFRPRPPPPPTHLPAPQYKFAIRRFVASFAFSLNVAC